MNADRLLALYEKVADAPDAVPRLRRFVLDLAVRGKLVPQEAGDELASELLKQIATEKARLFKAGEIKQPKPIDPVTADEKPFPPPHGWTWTHLADIAVCLDYMRKPINGTERDRRIEGKSEDELFPYFGATQQQGWIDDYIFDEELVLLGEDGVPFFDPYRSKAYIISGKTWVNNHAHVFKGILISHSFLAHYLNVFDYTGRVVGATRSKLNQARAVDIPVPLPPLAEQRRIVAKVEELMALMDWLEAARGQREATRDRLTAASLARLTASDTGPDAVASSGVNARTGTGFPSDDAIEKGPPGALPAEGSTGSASGTATNQAVSGKVGTGFPSDTAHKEDSFPANARFALATLRALTTRPDQIKPLRQTILNLAVRGKLTFDAATDTGQPSCTPTVADDPKPYDVHATWKWFQMDELVHFQGGSQPPKSTFIFEPREGYTRLVQIRDFKSDANLTFVPSDKANRPFSEDDVMIGRYGPPVFQILRGLTGTFNVALMKASPKSESISKDFLFLLLQESRIHDEVVRESERTAGQTGVRLPLLRSFLVALPPLAEQHRIVAKVDAFMALCDRLEAALTTADTTRARLLEALLHEALDPAAEAVTEAAE